MKQKFNTPELNAGFQLDMSVLTPEQRGHVEAIFKARGVTKCNDWVENCLLNYDSDENSYAFYPEKIAGEPYEKAKVSNNLIDYPTLCRGSVQLEPYYFCIAVNLHANTIMQYANIIGIYETEIARPCGYFAYVDGVVVFCEFCQEECSEIFPEEFEQKLKGIYPVAKAEKPKYYKGINHNNLIVKFIADTDGDHFEGVVVESNCDYPVGLQIDTWYNPLFEPCEYLEPIIEFVDSPICKLAENVKKTDIDTSNFGEDSLKETIADCGEKTLMDNPTIADHIGSHMNLGFGYAKELVNENTRLRAQLYRLPILEQQKALLKLNNEGISKLYRAALNRVAELENKLNFANPQLVSLSQSNTDLQKQVEELTQQVFDLKRLL